MDKMPEMASIEQRSGMGVVSEVRAVQVAGDLLFVTAHEARDKTDWGADKPANRYFTIDTRTLEVTNHPTLETLRSDAAIHQVSLQLVPTEKVLGSAVALAWPGRFFFLLLLSPPVIVTAWLIKSLRVLRRRPIQVTNLSRSELQVSMVDATSP